MPLIDVAIPVHNEEAHLEEAVRSILSQEEIGGDIRILLADDGSTDGTPQICQALAENDPRITLLRNDANLGIIATLNRCLERSDAKYFARMDADDIALPRRLATQVDFMRAHALSLCGGEMLLFGQARGRMRCASNERDYAATLLFRPPFGHPTAMMDRERMAARGLRYEHHPHAEDYGLWGAFFLCGEPAACIPAPLLKYRVREASVSRTEASTQLKTALEISIALWERRDLAPSAQCLSVLRDALAHRQFARHAPAELLEALSEVRAAVDPALISGWARSEFVSFCMRFFQPSDARPDRAAALRILARLDAAGCWTYHWRRKLLSDRL